MDERVTISDVASKCGVSLSTVSLVLNNKPGVSSETRSKVMEIVEQLGYPLKQNTTCLRSNKLSTLGMIVKTDIDSPPYENPFFSRVILGIEEGCRRNGISLLFSTLPVDEQNRPVETPPLLHNDSIDGLLLVGAFIDETVLSISGRRTPPIVLVDGYSNNDCFDAVVSDNFRASYKEVEYIINKGHHHIALAGGEPLAYPSIRERRQGYLHALKDYEITDTYIANFNINKTRGFNEITWMLKEHPQISAIFCVNDEVAVTAMKVAQQLGLRVPQDISIAGYDDIYLSHNSIPALTTMRVDTTAMGRAAVHLLSFRLDNPDAPRMTLSITSTLIERDSVIQQI